jgi:hypothetical protein
MKDLVDSAITQLKKLNATISIANVICMMGLLDNSECYPLYSWEGLSNLLGEIQLAIELEEGE